MFIVEVENTKTTGDININWGTFIIGTQQGVSHGKEWLKLSYSMRNSSAKQYAFQCLHLLCLQENP